MSNAEEIIDQYEPSMLSNKERWGKVAIKKMMQAHTNQTLQELKEKVEQLPYGYKFSVEKKDVITLIDEAINE